MSEISPKPNFLQNLINAAEKASNIARICRSNEKLLELLVQEKTGSEANPRFKHDFKTLADVLIQETIKKDIGALFPALLDLIKGEESPNFKNSKGETISIIIGVSEAETAECLAAVLQDNIEVAEILAFEVHRDVVYHAENLGDIPELDAYLDYSNLGVWIDPIDATGEYIQGKNEFTNYPTIAASGLDCVTVLIGVFDRETGEPVIGVISQPFYEQNDVKYESLIFWGVALPDMNVNNIEFCPKTIARAKPLGILSSSESGKIEHCFTDMGFETTYAAGAGYKALKVITGDADIYFLSRGSTFKWDTCAPQAILRSIGGNIFDFRKSHNFQRQVTINYLEINTEKYAGTLNNGGIIAVRDSNLIKQFLAIYSET